MRLPAAVSSPRATVAPSTGEGFSPALMVEAELSGPLPSVRFDGRHGRVWVLGRLHTEPVGACVLQLGEEGLTPDQFAALLWGEFREPVTARFTAAGLPPPATLTGAGLGTASAGWPFLSRRSEVLEDAPSISVVLCTRDRPDRLRACLSHLDRQEYPRFEVVVVDNAPTSDAVRGLIKARQGGVACRYVCEPRAGLSWARNAGTAAASGTIIAFLDDDEEPDSYWLAGLARGFAHGDHIGCVSGMILPASLDSPVQEWFEASGGHSKGRGFAPAVFSPHGPQSPLYPLPPFGAGGNMAFRREALLRIGGFDVALGAGTPACGGEDTLALTLVLLAGYSIAYEPAAFVRHNHYAHPDGLGRQLYGYGVGLTAYYLALLRHRPGVFPALLGLIPRAVGYMRKPAGTGRPAGSSLPPELQNIKRRGMVTGPVAYLRSVRRQARVRTRGAGQ